jgi:hypothetical protein
VDFQKHKIDQDGKIFRQNTLSKKLVVFLVVIGLIGIVVFALLFLQSIRNSIIIFAEKYIVRRELAEELWHQILMGLGLNGIVAVSIILIQVLKEYIKKTERIENWVRRFVFIIMLSFTSSSIILCNNPNDIQRNTIDGGTDIFFMDFFAVLQMIQDRDPYSIKIKSNYPPLSYLILYPFSQLEDYRFMMTTQWGKTKLAIMSVFLWDFFMIVVLFYALNQFRKKYSIPFYILVGLFFSYVCFFSIERGNLIILAAACSCLFLCYYNSPKRSERIFAGIALALAINLKIYPVIFGFLYFERKQYKEIFFAALMTSIFFFLPFLFFKEGFNNIPRLLYTAKMFSLGRGHFTLWLPGGLVNNIGNLLICGVTIILSILEKNTWRKLALITLVVLYLPSVSFFYCGLYMFPVIIAFFKTIGERSVLINIFIFTIFLFFLNPFQFGGNMMFANIVLIILWFVVIVLSLKQIILNDRCDTVKVR